MKNTIGMWILMGSLSVGYAQSTVLRFQEGVWEGTNNAAVSYNVEDMRTSSAGDGSDTSLTVRRFPSGYFTTGFRFDLTAAAAYGMPVEQVTLTLRVNFADQFGPGGGTHYVRALPAGNTNWTEATATGAEQAIGIPWKLADNSDAADSWNAAVFGTLVGTKTFTTTPSVGDYVVYDLDATVVNQWLANPASYAGFVILQPNSDPFYLAFFDASESATASFRPMLQMVVPEPTTAAFVALGGLMLLRRRRIANG